MMVGATDNVSYDRLEGQATYVVGGMGLEERPPPLLHRSWRVADLRHDGVS